MCGVHYLDSLTQHNNVSVQHSDGDVLPNQCSPKMTRMMTSSVYKLNSWPCDTLHTQWKTENYTKRDHLLTKFRCISVFL